MSLTYAIWSLILRDSLLRNIPLRSLLHNLTNLTVTSSPTDQNNMLKKCVSLTKNVFFFSIEDTMIIQNNYKEKSWLAYKIWKNHPSKNGIISLLSTYRKKIRETRSMDRRLGSGWPRTVSKEENMDLIEEFIFSQEQQLHMH